MKRHVLTGAPGAGKTALLRGLEADGFAVVEEAATNVIALAQARGVAEPWLQADFVDAVLALQCRRQRAADRWPVEAVLFDRSPVCTLALARFLGRAPTPALAAELDRIASERTYRRRVLFVRNLGFCEPTAARRISFDDSLRFEQVHLEVYDALGYACVPIEAADLDRRIAAVRAALAED
ncbi:MAG: AAA family ATPase [Alphaproteobacteria bacterium]